MLFSGNNKQGKWNVYLARLCSVLFSAGLVSASISPIQFGFDSFTLAPVPHTHTHAHTQAHEHSESLKDCVL